MKPSSPAPTKNIAQLERDRHMGSTLYIKKAARVSRMIKWYINAGIRNERGYMGTNGKPKAYSIDDRKRAVHYFIDAMHGGGGSRSRNAEADNNDSVPTSSVTY